VLRELCIAVALDKLAQEVGIKKIVSMMIYEINQLLEIYPFGVSFSTDQHKGILYKKSINLFSH